MKKAIVTGANGFIGAAVVKELVSRGIHVTAVIRNKQSDVSRLKEILDISFVYCDLSELNTLPAKLDEKKYDLFYHFAWEGSSGEKRGNSSLQLQNAHWSLNAVEIAHMLSCEKIIVSGSIMEQEVIHACFEQGNRPNLAYVYGSGKLAAHTMCSCVATQLNIKLVWANITNAYGPEEYSPRFINSTIRKIQKGESLQFTSGTQNYDFIYIDDVARAFYHLGMEGKGAHHYLIGSGAAKPLKEFILKIRDALEVSNEFIFGDIPYTGVNLALELFDVKLMEQHTSFRPLVGFEEGIKKTEHWIKETDK